MQIGDTITYTTDAKGNVTAITHADGDLEIYTDKFVYDTQGNVKTQTVSIPKR